jgi:hypothetical protein
MYAEIIYSSSNPLKIWPWICTTTTKMIGGEGLKNVLYCIIVSKTDYYAKVCSNFNFNLGSQGLTWGYIGNFGRLWLVWCLDSPRLLGWDFHCQKLQATITWWPQYNLSQLEMYNIQSTIKHWKHTKEKRIGYIF